MSKIYPADTKAAIHKEDFSQYCRDIPDFPKPGIIFRDITNLLNQGPVFKRSIDAIAAQYKLQKIDSIV